ncbi:MAG: hypothetical protein GYA14_01345 [Ignavibacteria bacterium]|nr:hypothetical protein [Ignavibacteria bacterium]
MSAKKSNLNEDVFSFYKKQMNWRQVDNYLGWGIFNNIGYIRSDDLMYFDLGKFDLILDSLKATKGLILDLRKNSGGFIGYVAEIVGRFSSRDMDLGYFMWRNGPKHNDYEPLQKITSTPISKTQYTQRVSVLIGRESASACEFLAYSMNLLDNVILVGDTTKGNVISPTQDSLKDGTIYEIPRAALLDINQQPLEGRGAVPDYYIRYDENNLNGKDPIIDFAFEYLKVNNAYNKQLLMNRIIKVRNSAKNEEGSLKKRFKTRP